MRETTKANARSSYFPARYLAGRTIDIGCGNDPVTPQAERFDLPDGDANDILRFRPAHSYDCVYSSHCLEHMKDPISALSQWWSLVKPGGYLILIVPHEDLYEQRYWPSLFNRDHKATFRIGRSESWSPVSIDLRAAVTSLPDSDVISVTLQDDGYDYRLQGRGKAYAGCLRRLSNHLVPHAGTGTSVAPVCRAILRLLAAVGTPVDQTRGAALAQIQAIASKRDTAMRAGLR
jgi:SAM-dependent methyltransferase